MSGHEYEIGLPKNELDTPALLVDLDTMERNLQTMADYFATVEANLRAHVKLHKATAALAHRQLAAGSAGLTCAKLSEAESLASAGIKDILIANEIVGARKIQRLVNLAAYTDIIVAVDNADNVADLSRAAQARGVQLRVLVEVNVGHKRCGVAPFEPALQLARAVHQAPGLIFKGVMGYDGHCTMKVAESEREACSRAANELLVQTRDYIEAAGLKVEIVSGGGTFTYRFAATTAGITEVQAGTYLFNDTAFAEHGVRDFGCALTVLATVISRPGWAENRDLAVIDVGRKNMDAFLGLPEVKSPEGATVFSMSQEHGRVRLEGAARDLRVGDKIELWARDANTTINLYDRFYAMRDGIVEAVWEIPAQGRGT
jgi:D-serine deaminase-like pyridoxal phosphate-dependent protein